MLTVEYTFSVAPYLEHDEVKEHGDEAVSSLSGVLKMTLRADRPEARPTRNWVCCAVLPAIIKTGGYMLREEARPSAYAGDRAEPTLPHLAVQPREASPVRRRRR